MNIKAIQTVYAGHKFRSRLEARWAVFFDALGIEWQYEPEGFSVDGSRQWSYLPDFYLPESKVWVEVKGDWASCSDDYFEMLNWLAEGGSPLPHMSNSDDSEKGGLILLGPIPKDTPCLPTFVCLTNHKGGCICCAFFFDGALIKDSRNSIPFACGEEIKCLAPNQWCIEDRENHSRHAYTKARQARFEFGETPVR